MVLSGYFCATTFNFVSIISSPHNLLSWMLIYMLKLCFSFCQLVVFVNQILFMILYSNDRVLLGNKCLYFKCSLLLVTSFKLSVTYLVFISLQFFLFCYQCNKNGNGQYSYYFSFSA